MPTPSMKNHDLLRSLERRARHVVQIIGPTLPQWDSFEVNDPLRAQCFVNTDRTGCCEWKRSAPAPEGALIVFDSIGPTTRLRGRHDYGHTIVAGNYDGRAWVRGEHSQWISFDEFVSEVSGVGDRPLAAYFAQNPLGLNVMRQLKRPLTITMESEE